MLSDISHTEKDKYCLWSLKHKLMCLVTQLCQTLCDPMDCSLPGSSVHGNSPGNNTGIGCHALLQGIFPTQGSNLGLPHYRWIFPSEPSGKPKNTGVGSLSLLQGNFPSQESAQCLLHCRWILFSWATREAHVITLLSSFISSESVFVDSFSICKIMSSANRSSFTPVGWLLNKKLQAY